MHLIPMVGYAITEKYRKIALMAHSKSRTGQPFPYYMF